MSRAGEDGEDMRDGKQPNKQTTKKKNVQQWRNLTPEEKQEQEVLGGRRSSVG